MPHKADANEKTIRPRLKMRLGPKISPNAPALSSRAANASVYASTVHCNPLRPIFKLEPRLLRATLTTVASKLTIKKPIQTVSSARDLTVSCSGVTTFLILDLMILLSDKGATSIDDQHCASDMVVIRQEEDSICRELRMKNCPGRLAGFDRRPFLVTQICRRRRITRYPGRCNIHSG
ncbi:protein of unknown function [Serratia sp. Tan611]|nr:protein of unknown function [Serratia sp. Tan611]